MTNENPKRAKAVSAFANDPKPELKAGGPAFPPTHDPASHPSGMTLRDYFAAQALTAFDLHEVVVKFGRDPEKLQTAALGAASLAYDFADAMLEVRGRS